MIKIQLVAHAWISLTACILQSFDGAFFFSLSIASRKYNLADWWKQLNHGNIPEAIWSVKITKYRSVEGFVPLRKHLSVFFKMIEHYASNYGYSIGIEFLNEKEDNFLQSAIFFFCTRACQGEVCRDIFEFSCTSEG